MSGEEYFDKYGCFIVGFIFIIFVFVLVLRAMCISSVGSSLGSHNGIITSVEYNSNLVFSADIVYFKSDMTSSQEDRYCVNSDVVKNKLIEYSKNNERVTIFYSNDFVMWRWMCNGGSSIIYEVKK